MELRDYVRALRRRWLLILVALVAGGATGQAVTLLTPRTYEATAQLFVAVRGSDSVVDLNQGNAFAQGRVASYVLMATNPEIIAGVSAQLGITADDAARSISARNPDKTVLIDISATSPDPEQAARIADAAADGLVALVGTTEGTGPGETAPVGLKKVQGAVRPEQPSSPNPAVDLAVGLLLGLALGASIAVLRDRLDTRLRGRESVEAVTNAGVLGAFAAESSAGAGTIVLGDRHSPRAEAFRQLRTHLQFANVDDGIDSVLVTSSIPGEGKSTTAVNLAVVLAESGNRVLLVDGDLRRPTVASLLGLEPSVGLTTVLTGRIPLADAVQPVAGTGGLTVLTSGALPPNPSELLASAAMERTLGEMKKQYDVVVVDSPPLVNVADPGALATLVSGVLLVASVDGRLHRDQLSQSLRHLEFVKARLLGLVLNRVAKSRDLAGYYAYEQHPPEHARGRSRRRAARRPAKRPGPRREAPAPSEP